ncbi:hypothetical protein H0H92_005892 [Tricholoma furcatifolium]|nr:hypothetical protein H0H92_005892 [Tricholoma furcatifolium]
MAPFFVSLHDILKDPFELPPKRLITTNLIPSTWVDDSLITERKAGLTKYLSNLLKSPKYKDSAPLLQFLCDNDDHGTDDAMCSRSTSSSLFLELKATDNTVATAATPIAAAYYEKWTAAGNPP